MGDVAEILPGLTTPELRAGFLYLCAKECAKQMAAAGIKVPVFSLSSKDMAVDGVTPKMMKTITVEMDAFQKVYKKAGSRNLDAMLAAIHQGGADASKVSDLSAVVSLIKSIAAQPGAGKAKASKQPSERLLLIRSIRSKIEEAVNLRMDMEDMIADIAKEIDKKSFPIDAVKLVRNYFKESRRDAERAFNILTTNPAMFSPILVNKNPRKPIKPEDARRINQEIGRYLKTLKV